MKLLDPVTCAVPGNFSRLDLYGRFGGQTGAVVTILLPAGGVRFERAENVRTCSSTEAEVLASLEWETSQIREPYGSRWYRVAEATPTPCLNVFFAQVQGWRTVDELSLLAALWGR